MSSEAIRLTIRQMDRMAIWRKIERNAERERVAVLGRALGRFAASLKNVMTAMARESSLSSSPHR
jgi:hypothetical protein